MRNLVISLVTLCALAVVPAHANISATGTQKLVSTSSVPATGTVALWAKATTANDGTVIDVGNSGHITGGFYANATQWRFESDTQDYAITSATATNWTFLAYSWTNNSTGQAFWGTTGTGLTAITSTAQPNLTPTDLTLGNARSFASPYSGRIVCVKVWSAALTQTELENEYKRCRPSRTTNLSRWLPTLNHATETLDWSGNALTMTATGTWADNDEWPPGLMWGSQ